MSRSRRRLYPALAALATVIGLAITTPVTASAATPDHLAFTTGPTSGTADDTVAVEVTVEDAAPDNNAVAGNNDSIELTLNSGTIDAGGDAVSATDGVASFTLEIHQAGTYTLTARDATTTSLDDVTSGEFTISPGAPDQLAFDAQPTDTFTHEAIQTSSSGPVTVRVEDQFGNLETGDNSTSVSIALSDGSFTPGSATDATASGGIASFGSLIPEPDAEGTGRSLTASSGTLTPETSGPFEVKPSADLSIVKTGPVEEFAGNSVEYTLSVHNAGPSTAATPSVTESFPSDVTNPRYCIEGSCSTETDFTSYAGPISLSDLASVDDVTIKVRADIPSSEPKDTVLQNSASVSSTTHDPNDPPSDSNNTSGPIDTTVQTAADLSVTVTPTPDGSAGNDVIAGNPSNEVFKVDVLNGGPSDGGSYTLTFNVSRLGDTGGTGTDLVNAPAGCSADNANDKVVCNRSGIAAHTHDIFDITVSISSSYVNPPNSATLTYKGTVSDQVVTDPTSPNDTTGDLNLTVIARADLGIAVSFEQEAPGYPGHDAVAGTNEIFHMKVTNYGYSDNRGFTATLTVPDYDSQLTLQSAPGCAGTPATHKVTCTYAGPPFFSPGDQTFDITFHISPSYTNPGTTKQLHYSAALSGLTPTDQGTANGGQGTHLDSTGDQSLNVDSVADVSDSDLAVFQTAAEQSLGSSDYQPLNPGNLNSVLYTVTVKNTGPSDAQNVRLTETLPSSTLQTGANKIKFCVGVGCTPHTPYYTNTTPISLGTLGLNASAVVRFQAPLIQSLRRGAAASYPSGNATAVAATDATDPNGGNNTNNLSIDLFTVPDAPTLQEVEPGNNQLAVSWVDGANGGDPITGYDIIANGTPYFVPIANTSLASGTRSAIFPASYTQPTSGINNGTGYTIKVEARNGAGDSSPSSTSPTQGAQPPFTPCSTCVIRLVTGATTLNTFNTSITTGKCFPGPQTGPGAESLPGATSNDPVVSCFQLTSAQAGAKPGFVTALRETAVGATTGSCPTGSTCVGPVNQRVSYLVPPGAGTSTQIIQTVLYDKTVAASVYGDLCNKLPCATKSMIYDVFLNGQFIGSSLTAGDPNTGRPAWCTLTTPTSPFDPVTNPYIIPTGKTACVVSYVHINTSQNPSKINGNTPNGKQGNGDFRLDIVFLGDGGLTTCRTCR